MECDEDVMKNAYLLGLIERFRFYFNYRYHQGTIKQSDVFDISD